MNDKIGHDWPIGDFSASEISGLWASGQSLRELNCSAAETEHALQSQGNIAGSDDSISVWKVGLEWADSELRPAIELLSADEQERAKRFHRVSDRKHFIVARAALRLILTRYLRVDPKQILFDYNAFGKPRLMDGAHYPDIRFNLAHSRSVALYAFAIGRELGIDLEPIEPDFATMNLAQSVFGQEELAALSVLNKEDFVAGFYRCWTRKEAYLKGKGLGLSVPLNSFVVSVAPNETPLLLRDLNDTGEHTKWILVDLVAGQGFSASLAVEGRNQFQLAGRHSELTAARQ